jgi:hypothetical protein
MLHIISQTLADRNCAMETRLRMTLSTLAGCVSIIRVPMSVPVYLPAWMLDVYADYLETQVT